MDGWGDWKEIDLLTFYPTGIPSFPGPSTRCDINSNLFMAVRFKTFFLLRCDQAGNHTHSENTLYWFSLSKRSWELGWLAARACLWVCLGRCLKGSRYMWCRHQICWRRTWMTNTLSNLLEVADNCKQQATNSLGSKIYLGFYHND